ncbi:replicative DNA helicase [Pseudoxanthomonas sp. PXM05]|uniref:replicative DNA helicase n=1 Tax=Pseudoxanthomonas sp. PXM05 TaxID=2854775 RepID=UPI001C47CF53|nr:replicative DNA helicase [Pseudoxanthomonas sp. PXM05]MBV7475371.1 replicative DNA helicase [Pseudoxanthomonas sp. PXM05]
MMDFEEARVLPHRIDAERAVLGGLMLAPEALWQVQAILTPEDFYRQDHQMILRGIEALAERKKPFDAVVLADWFESLGQAELVDNGAYLTELSCTTPSAANIVAYAEIVAEMALRRRVIEVGTEIVGQGFDTTSGDAGEVLANAQVRVSALLPKQRGGLSLASDSLKDWFKDLERRFEAKGGITGTPWPWSAVNAATHGLQDGELTLIAGRPSMGKSIAGLNLALMNACRGVRTAVFSLEMSRAQINRRNIASLGNVPHNWLLAPSEDEDHWGAVSAALRQLKEASLYVDDTPDLTIVQLMARARSLHMKERIRLLVVDHIHDFKVKAQEARFEYGRIAQGMKTLAKEFNCPVVGLAQLNRALATRTDKRPTMSDLRESGELEQKADVIAFLHREDYYNRETYLKGVVELIIAKGRDIEAGKTIYLRNDFAHMALRDWEGEVPVAELSPAKRAAGERWGKVASAGPDF